MGYVKLHAYATDCGLIFKGGKPYNDLLNAFEYLGTNLEYKYIDLQNAVALGASYGGCWFPLHNL
jgi:hypothetical protein